jgi:tryptophan synthase beta subunit
MTKESYAQGERRATQKTPPNLQRDARVIVNLSGRGDKDVSEVLRVRGGAG